MKNAFVYCWTDHKTGKLYVGSHKGTIDDGYICSSKYLMEEYDERPEDFTRQIIAEGEIEDIRKLEMKILSSVDARKNKNFYNMHNGTGYHYRWKHTEESRKNIGEHNKRRLIKEETREKLRNNAIEQHKNMNIEGKNNPNYGNKWTEEQKLRLSKKLKGNGVGIKKSEETKKRMSDARKEYWKKTKIRSLVS